MIGSPLTPAEFDPLDYDNLAKSRVRELMGRGPYSLPLPGVFYGAGIYAIFYTGDVGSFPPYDRWASPKADEPIYVGKAIPSGSRRGTPAVSTINSRPLHSRLSEHAASIANATNLDGADFLCRFLVMKPVWITLAERFVIDHYRPVWNGCFDWFGIHDPGSGRHQGEVSWWDALHPGRPFAGRLRQTRTHDDALRKLATC
ncbi:MAG: Eco29kI family restriction endonuclease [Chloroflexota bacterium]|nr:Eco29kI family restriction endonuclease [Chloroflexota bacterium]